MLGLFKKKHKKELINEELPLELQEDSIFNEPLSDSSELEYSDMLLTGEGMEQDDFKGNFAIELMTPVPIINAVPYSWGRNFQLDVVYMRIKAQVLHLAMRIGLLCVVIVSLLLLSYIIQNVSSTFIISKAQEATGKLGEYDASISSSNNVRSIFEFIQQDVPIATQARAILKVCVESSVVVHSLKFDMEPDTLPQNVKDSFETVNGLALDEADVRGVWHAEGTFLSSAETQSEKDNEAWLLENNKKLGLLFTGTGVNAYLDMVASDGGKNTQQGYKTIEVIFWSNSKPKHGQ